MSDSEIVSLYALGYSGNMIAEMLGTSTHPVYDALARLGRTRTLSEAQRVRNSIPIIEALALYDATHSPKRVEEEIGVDTVTLHWWVVKRRADPEWVQRMLALPLRKGKAARAARAKGRRKAT